jgi:hypothetical protein
VRAVDLGDIARLLRGWPREMIPLLELITEDVWNEGVQSLPADYPIYRGIAHMARVAAGSTRSRSPSAASATEIWCEAQMDLRVRMRSAAMARLRYPATSALPPLLEDQQIPQIGQNRTD